MRLFTHAESGQLTYTPLSLDTAKHSRYILSTSLYTKRKTGGTSPPSLFWEASEAKNGFCFMWLVAMENVIFEFVGIYGVSCMCFHKTL